MTDRNADIDAIRKLAEDWSAGWDKGDIEALLSLYTDDTILLPQGQPQVIGKDAIRSQYRSLFREFSVKGAGEVMEIEVSGDLGYFWSHYTLTAIPNAGGEQVAGKGKSIFIVKRQRDHSWKISRLIDNSDTE